MSMVPPARSMRVGAEVTIFTKMDYRTGRSHFPVLGSLFVFRSGSGVRSKFAALSYHLAPVYEAGPVPCLYGRDGRVWPACPNERTSGACLRGCDRQGKRAGQCSDGDSTTAGRPFGDLEHAAVDADSVGVWSRRGSTAGPSSRGRLRPV